MSHCHDEHEHHGHDHAEGAAHDHTDDLTPALQNHIYEQIDFSAINTLNEAEPRSGARVVQKTWTERLNADPELNSDADEQLLMHIPFTAQIRLHSILIRTSATSNAPQTLKVYINRDDLDFSTASSLQSTQTLELSQTNDVQEVPVKRALFNTVRSLDMFFEDNWSQGEEDGTVISYIGFKGEWMKLSREPVNFLYEAAANPADHKLAGGIGERLGSNVGGAGGGHGMQRILQGPLIRVLVGSDAQVYSVHEKLLERSLFFQAALKKGWREDQERCVKLPEDEPSTISAYIQWLYDGSVDSAIATERLAKLYVLGEKLGDTDFQDRVIDIFIYAQEWGFLAVPEAIKVIYEGTPEGSPAQKLMVDMHLEFAERENTADQIEDMKFPQAFWQDLVTAMIERRRSGRLEDFEELSTGAPCSYHLHREGECKSKLEDM